MCPVNRLGQYIYSACSHQSLFTSLQLQLASSSVQLILARLNSEQLPVSLRLLLSFATLEIRTLMWSLGISTKYPLDKGHARPQLL